MPEHDDEGFLLRWSRRKRAAARGGDAKPEVVRKVAPEATGTAGRVADGTSGRTDAAPVENADATLFEADATSSAAPDVVPGDLEDVVVEDLDYRSDFERFMRDDVPEALQRRALRQLWRSDPILANVDGLNDYDEDFSDAALAVKVLETAHKVGRGFLSDAEADGSEAVTAAMSEEAGDKDHDEPASIPDAAADAHGSSDVQASDEPRGASDDGVACGDADERPA